MPHSDLEEIRRLQGICQKQAEQLKGATKLLRNLADDCLASDFNEHWDSYKNAEAFLRQ